MGEYAAAVFELGARVSLAIVLGGTAGTLARLALVEAIYPVAGFPWGTFAANVAGAALLGFFVGGVFMRSTPGSGLIPLLGTGFCGGLTTFSALQVDAVILIDRGDVLVACLYVAASLVAGLAAVVAAERLGERVSR